MKNRILALLLALVLVVGMLPVTALAAETTPMISNVNMTLNGILNVNFKVNPNGADDMSGYSVKVTSQSGTQNISTYTREGDLYVYSADVMPHRIHEPLAVQLMNGSEAVGEEKTFTVAAYIADVKEKYPDSTSMHTLLDTLSNYGSYAAGYQSLAIEGMPVADADAIAAVSAAALERYKQVLKVSSTDADLTAQAALYLDQACDLQIKFAQPNFTNKGHTLLVDGVAVAIETVGSQAVYSIQEILPQNWDKAYNFKVQDSSGNTVFEVNYSVLSYAYGALSKNTAEAKMLDLLKAMYNYYAAAEGYNGTDTFIVTPNSTRFLYQEGKNNGYRFIFDTTNSNVKTAVDFINTHFNALAGDKIDYPGGVDQVNWDMSKKYIVVGNHTMFAAAGLEMPNVDLGETGYYIVTSGNSVFIMVGENADEAQAYQLAALAFLKAVVGYEMYAEDCVSYTVADGKNFTLPDIKIICKPDVDYRNEGNYGSVGGGSYGMGNTDKTIFIPINGNVYHTALDLLNPIDHYSDHKDWFFLEKQAANWWENILGTQKYEHYQLCYSTILNDTQAQDIMYGVLKAAAVANPTVNNISFGPADNNYICDCNSCTAAGAVASYVKVANLLAERLANDPEVTQDVKLVCFAYRQYQNVPSGVTANEHVGVMVAPIEAAWNTPIKDQSTYADQIKAWANISDHLYIWYYQANFDYYLYPMDSWDVMQSNIQFARDNNADFVFYQNQSVAASHFSKLKDYLESALLKDADADYNTLVNNFFANYYGPAAEPMLKYFNALQTHMNTFSTGKYKEAIATTSNWLQAELQEYMGYINDAYAAVKASGSTNAGTYNSRIKLESLFPRFALLSLYSDTTTAGTANNFAVDCTALGVTQYNEGTAFSASVYSGWWNHTCSAYSEYAHDRCLVSGATEKSGAIYYKSCSVCGAINPKETFVSGSPLNHDTHTYEFEAGEGENEGYDVGTCFCGETVKVKTDYTTDSAPVDVIVGTGSTLTMPEGFAGTISQVKFGETATCSVANGVFDTSDIPVANHGLWTAIEVTFTSEYGGTHTAKIPATLITDVIDNVTELKTFAQAANDANTAATPVAMHGYYILGADIDCAGEGLATGNGGWNQGFFGTFDGRGHKISNLLVNNQGGIFGRLAGTVKNVRFEATQFKANTALFGKITAGATFTDVTVDIASWVSVSSNMTYAGILGVSENLNNTFDNFVINVAKDVSVSNLMGAKFSGTGDITVNLHSNAAVVNYYTDASGNAVTSAEGTIITVNTIAYNDYTVDTAITAESGAALTLTNASFTDGATATVTVGSGAAQTVTVSGNSITVNTTGAAAGQKNNVVVTIGTNTWTYNNVFFVTKILRTVDDLAYLNVGNTIHTKNGYYVLGNDIDCNGANIGGADTNNENNHNLWGNGFTGTFDGCGYAIQNATVTGYGIFGSIDGTIKNVKFEGITFAVNASLFARTVGQSSQASFDTVTIDIVGWNSTSTEAAIFGRSRNNKVAYSNVVINVADGLTITKLFGGLNDSGNTANITGNVIVNLGVGSSITLYFADATKPDFVTVNASYVPVEETIEDFVAAEGTDTLTLSNEAFAAGAATASIDGGAAQAITLGAGTAAVDMSGVAMGQHTVVITAANGDKFTYTNVWYVTQVIDTVAELKDLGTACKDSVVTGYYILGGDIDCSGETNMANGSGNSTTNGFSGIFDGRGHTISNITLNGTYGGLFGKLFGATIKNTVFDNVKLGTNGSLLAVGADKNSSTNVTTSLQNLTINLSEYATSYGAIVGYSMFNTVGSGIVINVADGLTITSLLARDNCNSIAYITATVNLGVGSTITNYYSGATAKPDTFTVNSSGREAVTENLDTLVAGENATTVSFTHSVLGSCSTAKVVINGVTKENVAIANDAITVDLADYGVTAMGQVANGAVITTDYGDVLTYTEVWYVTQVIDDATELKALGAACKAATTDGYYILGGDIDCSAEATMSNGSGNNAANGFSGTFDGRNKTISNITMKWVSNDNGGTGGLFGVLRGCTIQNTTFNNVKLGTNGMLLASDADKNTTTNDNTNLKNLTINLTAYSTAYGVLIGYDVFNTIATGLTINVADGLTIAALICRDYSNTISTHITATVNLGAGSTITKYGKDGSGNDITTPPEKITVIQK